MVKPVLTALLPMCVALILTCALMYAHLARATLTASADEEVRVGRYQFRVLVTLELTNVGIDTTPMAVDTLEGVSP